MQTLVVMLSFLRARFTLPIPRVSRATSLSWQKPQPLRAMSQAISLHEQAPSRSAETLGAMFVFLRLTHLRSPNLPISKGRLPTVRRRYSNKQKPQRLLERLNIPPQPSRVSISVVLSHLFSP